MRGETKATRSKTESSEPLMKDFAEGADEDHNPRASPRPASAKPRRGLQPNTILLTAILVLNVIGLSVVLNKVSRTSSSHETSTKQQERVFGESELEQKSNDVGKIMLTWWWQSNGGIWFSRAMSAL